MTPMSPLPDGVVDALRRRRAEMHESMIALELALAAPVPGDVAAWVERVEVALVELSADLRAHIELTEGEHGLHHDVVTMAPRLTRAVVRLCHEHVQLQALVDELLRWANGPVAEDGVATARERSAALLALLHRHRQRGADLVFEAYQTDIGGEA
jgi:hypothetical protein